MIGVCTSSQKLVRKTLVVLFFPQGRKSGFSKAPAYLMGQYTENCLLCRRGAKLPPLL